MGTCHTRRGSWRTIHPGGPQSRPQRRGDVQRSDPRPPDRRQSQRPPPRRRRRRPRPAQRRKGESARPFTAGMTKPEIRMTKCRASGIRHSSFIIRISARSAAHVSTRQAVAVVRTDIFVRTAPNREKDHLNTLVGGGVVTPPVSPLLGLALRARVGPDVDPRDSRALDHRGHPLLDRIPSHRLAAQEHAGELEVSGRRVCS